MFIGGCSATLLPNELPLKFKHFTTQQGLSASFVTCIARDHQGFMWFGTYNGLNKFDGYDFTVYRNSGDDSTSLVGNAVLDLLVDQKARLWIGTQYGLDGYDRGADHFQHFPHYQAHAMHVVDVAETGTGEILAVTSGQIFRVDFARSVCVPFELSFSAYPFEITPAINRVLIDRLNQLWIATSNTGLIRYHLSNHEVRVYHSKNCRRQGFTTDRVLDLVQDVAGFIWLATADGLYQFDPVTENLTVYKNQSHDPRTISTNSCYRLALDQQQNLWLGTHGGLNFLAHGSTHFRRLQHDPDNPASLHNNSIQSIYLDAQDNLWVGTLKGIDFRQQVSHVFTTIRDLVSPSAPTGDEAVTCFQEDRAGNLWIGTDGGGLHYFDRKKNTFTHYDAAPGNPSSLQSNAILTVFGDSKGRLWVGGFWAGLDVFDRATQKFSHILHSRTGLIKLKNDDVRHIYEDRQGDLWVATNGDGIFQFIDGNPANFRQFQANYSLNAATSLASNFCLVIYEDREQQLWIGTYHGLSMFDRQRNVFVNYSTETGMASRLSNNWIYAILEDSKGRFWLGTAHGLNLMNRKEQSFTVFGAQDGLPGEIINGILEDSAGYLWISTDNGLAKFNPETRTAQVYTVHDGLQENEFVHGAYASLSRGEFIFGGINGFTYFNPSRIQTTVPYPPVMLTRLQLFAEAGSRSKNLPREIVLNDLSQISLTHQQARIFSLHYVALEYGLPEKIQYRYRLEGYHDRWIVAGLNRAVIFMNPGAGDFRFKVAASNSQGVWGPATTDLTIHIAPPWWRSIYAYLGYGLVLLILLALYHHYALKFMRLKMDLNAQKIEKEKAYELQTLKARFFTNISHEFRTPLTLILVPLNDLITRGLGSDGGTLRERLILMKRSAERLWRLVNQVIDYNRLEAGQLKLEKKEIDFVKFVRQIVDTFHPLAKDKNITLKFDSNRTNCYARVDPDKIDMVIFNLLSNAFKFCNQGGVVSLNLQVLPENWLEIQVSDTGIGISSTDLPHIFDRFYQAAQPHLTLKQGSGIGLTITQELVGLHGGQISVQSEPGCGSCFRIRLPINSEIPPTASTPAASDPGAVENNAAAILQTASHQPDQPRLLIVEDEYELRHYLAQELAADFQVLLAGNGQEGWELAQSQGPDVILSDILMQGMDGIQFCRLIKSHELTGHIPVILLTARQDETQQLEGLETGADDYLTKPFNLNVLRSRLRNLLESRRQLRARFSREVRIMPQDIVVPSADEQFLKRAMEIVESNLAENDLDVQLLSHQLGLSRSQLFRKIKALTGLTPIEFIQNIRLKRAAQLLVKSQMTITEICYEVGFNYPSHFTKSFQDEFGISPKEYRKKHRSLPE